VVLLETNVQIECVHKAYYVPRRKLYRVFTTVDPTTYKPDPSVQKSKKFLCVFRGWLTPATGVEYIVEAARHLKDEDIHFRLIVRGQLVPKIEQMIKEYGLTNVELITDRYVDQERLKMLILEGHVYLGQFSKHLRLERTIQFKTIEACAFGLPYITADLPSNRELLTDGVNCLFTHRADPQDIADKILMLKNEPALCERLATAAHALYQQVLAPEVLAGQIIDIAHQLLA
jgi:glycosyltransferase involved in cell wall biosynthesis